MKGKITKKALTLSLLLTLLISACGRYAEVGETVVISATPTPTPTAPDPTDTPAPTETPTPIPAEQAPEGMIKSSVSGEWIDEAIGKRRPVAIMIDNVSDATPQSGISAASLYFESPVEARYTRMCAVFENYDDLTRIGPIRSCRDYFISLADGLDDIYTHYGQAAYALPYLESDSVDNLSGLAYYADPYFFRDNTYHVAPHNAYTSGKQLNDAIEARGYRKEHKDDYQSQYNFCRVGETVDMSDTRTAEYVSPGYPMNKPWFVYDAKSRTYQRFQYGGPHIDVENGEQLSVTNILFEFQNAALYQDSLYYHFDTVEGGRGVYISNGKCMDIKWKRPGFYGQVTYTDLNGQPLVINPGKTWVGVIQNQYLGDCMIGTSEEDLQCVVDEEAVRFAKEYNADWALAYKAQEDPYLSRMAQQREDWVAKHGRSKVEG